jgi:hypothetical protein
MWRRSLRHGSEVARLQGLFVRILPGHECPSLVSVCSQVEASASGLSLIQRSPTECGVPECDREASIMRMPLPNMGCSAVEKSLFKKLQMDSYCKYNVAKYIFIYICICIFVHIIYLVLTSICRCKDTAQIVCYFMLLIPFTILQLIHLPTNALNKIQFMTNI